MKRHVLRIEVLKRDRKQPIASRFKTADTLLEVTEFEEHQRRFYGGDGYRLQNLHTGEVTETWD